MDEPIPTATPRALAFVRNQLAQSEALLKTLTYDAQGRELQHRSLYPQMMTYIDGFLEDRTEPRWVGIAGLRGVGKTTLLAQLYTDTADTADTTDKADMIDAATKAKAGKQTGGRIEKTRKLYVSLDWASDLGLSLADILAAYEELFGVAFERLDTPLLLFLDEVQYQPTWARTVKALFDRARNVFVVATGSSAVALQTNPDIDRRMVLEKLYPFRFSEYAQARLQKSLPDGLDTRIRSALFSSADAREVYERLQCEAEAVADFWTGIDRFEIDRYLKCGSLPFALNQSNEQLVYQQIQRLIENIITKDVAQLNAFDKPTLGKISQLLYAIAGADVVSIGKLATTLAIDPKTVIQALDTLEKAEVLVRVYPHGAHSGQVRGQVKKPSKYLFTSSTYRAMYYNLVGSIEQYDQYKGRLLEDVVGAWLFHTFGHMPAASIAYDSAESGADFILTLPPAGRKVVLEVGLGKKGFEQASSTLRKVNGLYGLIVSRTSLRLDGDSQCVTVPLDFFLLA